MDILTWLVLGLVAGWIASMVMGTDAEQGPIMDIVLGIIGAVVGGYIVSLFGIPSGNGFSFYSLLVAVLGAVTLIWAGRLLGRNV